LHAVSSQLPQFVFLSRHVHRLQTTQLIVQQQPATRCRGWLMPILAKHTCTTFDRSQTVEKTPKRISVPTVSGSRFSRHAMAARATSSTSCVRTVAICEKSRLVARPHAAGFCQVPSDCSFPRRMLQTLPVRRVLIHRKGMCGGSTHSTSTPSTAMERISVDSPTTVFTRRKAFFHLTALA